MFGASLRAWGSSVVIRANIGVTDVTDQSNVAIVLFTPLPKSILSGPYPDLVVWSSQTARLCACSFMKVVPRIGYIGYSGYNGATEIEPHVRAPVHAHDCGKFE